MTLEPTEGLDEAAEEYAYNPDTPRERSGIRGEASVDPEEAFKAGARWQILRSSTPQEPDDDALIALDRLLRMTVPVPAGCVGAEGSPMSPEFRVSIQRVTGDGVHFIIHAHGRSSDTLDLVATPQRLALLARTAPETDDNEPDGFMKMHFEDCDYFTSGGRKSCSMDCCS